MEEDGGGPGTNADATRSALDGLAARLVALAVLILAAAVIVWLNREVLFPTMMSGAGTSVPAAADSPAALCLEERAAGIQDMLDDGTIDEGQAALFTSRAEALCEAQHGSGGGPPLPQ